MKSIRIRLIEAVDQEAALAILAGLLPPGPSPRTLKRWGKPVARRGWKEAVLALVLIARTLSTANRG